MREQFPLTLCYTITAHKSQGQTLEEVIIDFTSKHMRINYGSFYTALSRVKYGENLFLRDFKETYVKANPSVEKKMLSMKVSAPYIFKKVYNEEKIFDANEIKLGYLNINDLYHKKRLLFVNNYQNLLITLADKRLTIDIKSDDLKEFYLIGRF